jgi:hypothetical protein
MPMSTDKRYLLRRISTTPSDVLQITFNVEGRTRSFNAANSDDDPGSPQDVPLSTARAALGDPTLAPHFQCEPTPPAEKPATGPVATAAADKGETERSASRDSKATLPGK